MSTQGQKEVRLEAQAKLRVFPVTDLARPVVQRFPRRRVEKGVVNPKVPTLMGRDASFASEQRPTGGQSYISKDFFLCCCRLMLYKDSWGQELKGKAHTQSKQKMQPGFP